LEISLFGDSRISPAKEIDFLAKFGGHDGTTNFSNRRSVARQRNCHRQIHSDA